MLNYGPAADSEYGSILPPDPGQELSSDVQNSILTRKSAFSLTAACQNLRTTLLLT